MPAVFVNMGAVILGSILGLSVRGLMKENLQKALMVALALCTLAIGIINAVQSQDILCVILSMTFGTALGELLKIDNAIEKAGDTLHKRIKHKESRAARFSEGFTSASILFCVGSMTVMGSLQAGIHGDYSIIYAKSALDFVSALALASSLGIGVAFSSLFILLFQGALTLLAGLVGPALSPHVITELSAVGGTILIGMGINMLDLPKERIKIANMLPAIFLPIAYFPIQQWITSLFG